MWGKWWVVIGSGRGSGDACGKRCLLILLAEESRSVVAAAVAATAAAGVGVSSTVAGVFTAWQCTLVRSRVGSPSDHIASHVLDLGWLSRCICRHYIDHDETAIFTQQILRPLDLKSSPQSPKPPSTKNSPSVPYP